MSPVDKTVERITSRCGECHFFQQLTFVNTPAKLLQRSWKSLSGISYVFYPCHLPNFVLDVFTDVTAFPPTMSGGYAGKRVLLNSVPRFTESQRAHLPSR